MKILLTMINSQKLVLAKLIIMKLKKVQMELDIIPILPLITVVGVLLWIVYNMVERI